jgi:Domain of unknown function (DUF4169)
VALIPGVAVPNGASMGEIVNLRKVRKEIKKRDAAERAVVNRTVHGRSKVERTLGKTRTAKIDRHLDGHRIEPGDA